MGNLWDEEQSQPTWGNQGRPVPQELISTVWQKGKVVAGVTHSPGSQTKTQVLKCNFKL